MANKYRLDDRRFKNEVCQTCIKRSMDKYGKFVVNCEGITVDDDIQFAVKYGGMDKEEARYMYDPVYFFQSTFGSAARDYQYGPLRCTSKSLVSRQCRQTGKTLAITNKILHYVGTNNDKTVLIIAPQEKQIKKIWDEYIFRDGVDKNPRMKNSVVSKREKPFYQVTFDNGSKIILMIAGPGVRGQTADWIYIDEAALIPVETLNDIMMTIASRGDNATMILTSTPMGRGSMFYKACKEDPEYNEYHVTIYDVPEMCTQIDRFKKILGETGFIQEALAEFPSVSGGPFNLDGVSYAKLPYAYDSTSPETGIIYFGGVDWNGPGIGTYFYIIGFNTQTYELTTVDKRIVASANWNSTVAKNTLVELNRKWKPKHWMCDYGYGTSIIEELKLWSMREGETGKPGDDPDVMLKHIIEPVNFGLFLEIEDPFTKEVVKKTTKAFIVSQVARLFEPNGKAVPISFPAEDEELVVSLENYKTLNITAKGVEQYGFDKKDGIEDHAIDAFMLACYGVVKYYNELFKRIVMESVLMSKNALLPTIDDGEEENVVAGGIVLLTDNHPETIMLDENKIYDPTEQGPEILIARTFTKGGTRKNYKTQGFSSIMKSRGGLVKRSNF